MFRLLMNRFAEGNTRKSSIFIIEHFLNHDVDYILIYSLLRPPLGSRFIGGFSRLKPDIFRSMMTFRLDPRHPSPLRRRLSCYIQVTESTQQYRDTENASSRLVKTHFYISFYINMMIVCFLASFTS